MKQLKKKVRHQVSVAQIAIVSVEHKPLTGLSVEETE
jgi:hypothetical protein